MNSIVSFDNLVSWLFQVSIIALAGTLLPFLFKIRHPKSQLAYFHAVLIACIVFPLVQPRQYALLLTSSGLSTSLPAVSGTSWLTVLMWIVIPGIALRIFWLAMGYRHVCQVRRSAATLAPVPESIRAARSLTRTDAMFRLTSKVSGPATLGHLNPVILLPDSFVSMDEEAQLSIACHELIHVRRNDWMVTIVEEIVGAVFWFNPAVLWLLARIKLSREQLVDAEVVDITDARASYVQALLSMAVVSRGMKPFPAAPFFTKGHLHQRMRSLLTRRRGSASRLILSYASIMVLLVVVGWSVMLLFPLKGDAQIVAAPGGALLPPALHSWSDHLKASTPLKTFNVRVPEPKEPVQDNLIYINSGIVGGPASSESDGGVVPPPPPPPPPPPQPSFPIRLNGQPGAFVIQGVPMLRLGLRTSPEEVASVQAALGAVIEVQQSEEGVIQKITFIGRRSFDESNSVPLNYPLGPVGPGAAIHLFRSH